MTNEQDSCCFTAEKSMRKRGSSPSHAQSGASKGSTHSRNQAHAQTHTLSHLHSSASRLQQYSHGWHDRGWGRRPRPCCRCCCCNTTTRLLPLCSHTSHVVYPRSPNKSCTPCRKVCHHHLLLAR
jgi:hypothetical protein